MSDYTTVGVDKDTGQRWGQRADGKWERIGTPAKASPAPKDTNTFGAGLREMTLPGNPDAPLGQSLYDAAQHFNPVQAVREGRYEGVIPIGTFEGDMVRGVASSAKKAWELAKNGQYMEAAAELTRPAPLATIARNAGEAIDTGDPSRFLGNVTGMAGQLVAGHVGGKVAAALDARKGPVVEPPPATIPFDQPAPTVAGRMVEQTMGGRGVFKQAREADLATKQTEKTAASNTEYANEVDKHKSLLQQDVTDLRTSVDKASPHVQPGVDELQAGQNTGVSLAARKASAQDAFQQLDAETRDYQTTDPETGVVSGPVKPVRLLKEARGIAGELQDRTARYWGTDAEGNSVPYPVQNDLTNAVQSTLSQISNLQKSMTVQQAMELRTTLGEHLRSVAEVLPTRLERVVTRLEGALDTDVQSTLKRMSQDGSISKDTLAAADEARSTWRDLHEPFIRRITALSDTNPEAIAQEFWKPRTSVEDLALAKRVLPQDAYDTLQFHALRQKIVQPIVRNVTFKPNEGSGISGQKDTFQQLTAPERLIDTMEAVDDARSRAKLRYMVGPQLTEDIVNVAKQAAGRVAPKLDTELPGSGTNKMWNPEYGGALGLVAAHALTPMSILSGGLIGYVRAGLGGGLAGVAAGASSIALEYGMAKLLVSPGARAQLGRLASAVASGTAKTAEGLAITSALGARVRGYAEEYQQAQEKKKAAPASTPMSKPGPAAQTASVVEAPPR